MHLGLTHGPSASSLHHRLAHRSFPVLYRTSARCLLIRKPPASHPYCTLSVLRKPHHRLDSPPDRAHPPIPTSLQLLLAVTVYVAIFPTRFFPERALQAVPSPISTPRYSNSFNALYTLKPLHHHTFDPLPRPPAKPTECLTLPLPSGRRPHPRLTVPP